MTAFADNEFAAGWDAAAWNYDCLSRATLAGLADAFAVKAAEFAQMAVDDELLNPESATYKAGAAYAYRMAQAAMLDHIAAIESPR